MQWIVEGLEAARELRKDDDSMRAVAKLNQNLQERSASELYFSYLLSEFLFSASLLSASPGAPDGGVLAAPAVFCRMAATSAACGPVGSSSRYFWYAAVHSGDKMIRFVSGSMGALSASPCALMKYR